MVTETTLPSNYRALLDECTEKVLCAAERMGPIMSELGSHIIVIESGTVKVTMKIERVVKCGNG